MATATGSTGAVAGTPASTGSACAAASAPLWGDLEEDAAPPHEVAVEHLLDRVADAVGQLEHEHRVVGGLWSVLGGVDRLAEVDDPLRRQRQQTQRPEQRE